MHTFRITWSTPAGQFGWVDITECVDMDEALDYWRTEIVGSDVPSTADIDSIRPLS